MKETIIPYIIHEAPITREFNVVQENTINGEKKAVAEVILQDLDVQNRNKRIYTSENMLPKLNSDARIKELIESGNMKGENGHPLDNSAKRQQTIDPNNVCVKYLNIWNEGALIKATATATNTDKGEWFNRDLLEGEHPSFSLRAFGSLSNRNGKNYVNLLSIITWDRVIYPSHKAAYTQRLVESAGETDSMATFVVDKDYSGEIIPINDKSVINYIVNNSNNMKIMTEAFAPTSYDNVSILENGNVRLYNDDGSTAVFKLDDYILNKTRDYFSKK